jgi:ABC-2 type transport system ATP-binding protein
MSTAAIAFQQVTKSFRGRRVLEALDLEVARGEIFGYLGPNGAGKTTTIKVLIGLIRADSGRIDVLGVPHADPQWRYRIGYVPELPSLYDYLTPREYLDYAGRLLGISAELRRERGMALLQRLGLDKAIDYPMRRFSKGMLQKVAVAQALINDPELVILDEPLSGLDPIARHLLRDIILEMRQRGKTVFFSTHILSDAETLCDRVALLKNGRLATVGRIDEILNIEVDHLEVLVSGLSDAAIAQLPAGVDSSEVLGERRRLHVKERALGAVVSAVEQNGGRVLSAQPVRQSLEEYFVKEIATTWHPGD